jgi:hypothetical protein
VVAACARLAAAISRHRPVPAQRQASPREAQPRQAQRQAQQRQAKQRQAKQRAMVTTPNTDAVRRLVQNKVLKPNETITGEVDGVTHEAEGRG